MKALILAAGYATRLRPLTDRYPKELLPLAGRPIVDMILDKIAAVPAVDEIHLVTNANKAPMFAEWSPDARREDPQRRDDVERRPPRRDR